MFKAPQQQQQQQRPLGMTTGSSSNKFGAAAAAVPALKQKVDLDDLHDLDFDDIDAAGGGGDDWGDGDLDDLLDD
jgi:hypothetical protein